MTAVAGSADPEGAIGQGYVTTGNVTTGSVTTGDQSTLVHAGAVPAPSACPVTGGNFATRAIARVMSPRPSPTPRPPGYRKSGWERRGYAVEPAAPADPAPASPDAVDLAAAEDFLRLFYTEANLKACRAVPFTVRYGQIRTSIEERGSYDHTLAELTFGARVAWRNSARCIGRLYWNSLHVRDCRTISDPFWVAAESIEHLRESTRDGRIRSTITIFAPDRPGQRGPRIHNEQLIRYAGYRQSGGGVLGDPRTADLTAAALRLGWQRPEQPGPFNVLPLLITGPTGRTELYPVPQDAVLEVTLTHPEHDWFGRLGLRWHAVPAISNMILEIGGIRYPAAPFNGYYLGTEVGARNLADTDRYNMLPTIAKRLGLDTSSTRSLWQDRALVELVRAVHHSFDAAGVSMADHHTESERFLNHLDREERAGRRCPTDWSWIVPPMSASTTPVFHRYYDQPDPATRPAFLPPAPDDARIR